MKSPWKSNERLDPSRTYVGVATTLNSRRFRSTPKMFAGAQATAKQMKAAPGCIGFASQARPFKKNYRSISVWESEEALRAFVHSGAHGDLVKSTRAEVESFRSVHWALDGADGRPTWREGSQRLTAEAAEV